MKERVMFKMFLKPGCEKEYQKRHREIWPEIVLLLRKNGIYEYSIFWDQETNELFGFQKKKEGASSQDLGNNVVMQKWWKYMSDIMETNLDYSPRSKFFEEVFYME